MPKKQEYSLRYFEQPGGDIILPSDFTPSYLTVVLTGVEGNWVTQTVDWTVVSAIDDGED